MGKAASSRGTVATIERAVNLSDDFARRYQAWAKARKATQGEVLERWSAEAEAICREYDTQEERSP